MSLVYKKWSEILLIVNGKNQKAVEDSNGAYPIYGSGGIIGHANDYLCEAGTTIIGRKGTINNPIFVNERFWNVDTAFGITPGKKILPKYLYYFCCHFNFKSLDKSTTIPSLAKRDLLAIEMPVPSLEEQSHVVARIEKLFSELDVGVETLQRIKQQLLVYRRSVLSDAFEGRMTATWRKENNVKADCFIQKARVIRDAILRGKRLKQLKYEWKDDIDLPEIPNEWEYAQIGDVAWEIKDGPHYSPEYVDDGIPFITGGNVRPNGVDFQNAKRISPELHKELSKRCHPQKGDLLYTKGGTTGIARINTYDQEFSVWVHVAVIKYVNIVLPEYFQHVLNSPFCYQQSQKYTHGVGNQDLGLTRMINIIFPICSLEEQAQIVRELDSRLSLCDSIEKTVDEALQQSTALHQSVLKQAFEGGV